jgi:hypothetical protein
MAPLMALRGKLELDSSVRPIGEMPRAMLRGARGEGSEKKEY